jgi:luciferase-like monooxygenase
MSRQELPVSGAQKKIVVKVSQWEGVGAKPHRFGGTEFKLGRRELGHVHGDYQADIVFPMEVRDRLIAEGKVEPHHVLPESGWITFRFGKEADVDAAVELFRLSYDLARERQMFKAPST